MRNLNRLIASAVAASAALVLVACNLQEKVPEYQGYGSRGGFIVEAGPGGMDIVRVDLSLNHQPIDKAQDFVLYRCAEIAKAKGAPNFVIFDTLVAAALDEPNSMPRVGYMASDQVHATAFVLPVAAPRPGAKDTAATLRDLAPLANEQYRFSY